MRAKHLVQGCKHRAMIEPVISCIEVKSIHNEKGAVVLRRGGGRKLEVFSLNFYK